MNRYHGRVVAITGGAQGLGLAMATRFAAEGATVALADVNGEALAGQLRADVVDVTDSAQVNAWIAAVTRLSRAMKSASWTRLSAHNPFRSRRASSHLFASHIRAGPRSFRNARPSSLTDTRFDGSM